MTILNPVDVAKAVQCSVRMAHEYMRKAGATGNPLSIGEQELEDWFNEQVDENLRKRKEEELWPEDIMRLLGCTRCQAVGVVAIAGGHTRGTAAQDNPITKGQLSAWLKRDLSLRFVPLGSTDDRYTYVYFIACRSAIKIGYTGKIEQRVTGIQMLSPDPVRAVALLVGGKQLEAALHARFSAYRIHGEWFRNEGALAALLEKAP